MAETQERVLVYDRVDANRRNTLFLLGLFAVVLLPVAAYVTQYVTFLAFMALGLVEPELFLDANLALTIVLAVIIAVAIVIALAYLQFRYASALALRIAGAREVERDREPDLWRAVENLCIGAGLPQPRVYVVESAAANAFATGLDPEHASLVVTRGLLALLDRRELEAVLAHELSNIGNYDTRLSTVLAAGVGMLRLPLAIVLAFFRFLFRLHWAVGAGALLYLGLPVVAGVPLGVAIAVMMIEEDPALAAAFLAVMFVPFYVFLGAPLLGFLISRATSRQRELLADADAVLLTRYAEGLARALTKMGAAAGPRLKVGAATAHLYIVDPLPADAPWWDRAFSTHPPLDQRIAAVAAMGGGIPPSALHEAEEAGARFHSAAAPAAAAPPGAPAATYGRPDPVEATPTRGAEAAATAFRLTGASTPLYGTPDAASAPLGQLASGSVITVLEESGRFLRVLTSDDRFGYVLRTVPMTEVDRT